MENVYPKLKEFCRKRHGLEFQVSAVSHTNMAMFDVAFNISR